uniref:Cyclic AMP-dependent transcription factor ATF-7 n=1 Tax=Myripristis murdjan TaxID=586833 RepID=A0A667WCH3_9TELE
MNDEQDRPYVCGAPGCSQRFQLEEHLMIHRHKHEMTLKFPSIKTDNAFTDQTPTPTRFLRNCEEVGLFNEIEEEFLQAQEEEKSKQQPHDIHGSHDGDDATVPASTSTAAPPSSSPAPTSDPQLPTALPCPASTASGKHPQLPAPPIRESTAPSGSPITTIPSAPGLTSRAPPLCSSTGTGCLCLTFNDGIYVLQVSPVAQQIQPSQPSHSPHAMQPGASCGGGGGGGGRRRRTLEQDPDERRQKFLERNRAAATRCRQKRKVWVSSLEKKAEELTHTNLQLQNEVTSLRSEVGQLKQILLTHKDCPVTARQREAQGYPRCNSTTLTHPKMSHVCIVCPVLTNYPSKRHMDLVLHLEAHHYKRHAQLQST